MKREILVNVDQSTWPRGAPVPPELSVAVGMQEVNLASAFLMLGTLTMPDLLSPASPARFWAWLRYFESIKPSSDLRISMDFAGLDPHQKGILSDDFGVALSTQWFFDRTGGFSDIVDGRRFMLQFAHLLPPKTKAATAKVGPTKAPDYVIKDRSGKWHVVECKGTQSGRAHRDKFLKDALAQKRIIQINGRLRGERLAMGLAISNEKSPTASELRVVDPEADPLISLNEQQSEEIDAAAHRIAIARALGVVGLGEMAVELSLPVESGATDFLRPNERLRMRSARSDRKSFAEEQMRERTLQKRRFHGVRFESRSVTIDDSVLNGTGPVKGIRVVQGVNRDLIEEIAGGMSDETFRDSVEAYTRDAVIKIRTTGSRTTLTYGDVLYATLDLKEK